MHGCLGDEIPKGESKMGKEKGETFQIIFGVGIRTSIFGDSWK